MLAEKSLKEEPNSWNLYPTWFQLKSTTLVPPPYVYRVMRKVGITEMLLTNGIRGNVAAAATTLNIP